MEQMRKDLDQLTAEVHNLLGAMNYLSQRTAWNETCFKQVEDSGAMRMMETLQKVLADHKKLLTQVNILAIRLAALHGDSGGDSDGSPPPPMARPSMRKYGN